MIASLRQTLQALGIWVQYRMVSLLHYRWTFGNIWPENPAGAGLYSFELNLELAVWTAAVNASFGTVYSFIFFPIPRV